MSNWSSESRRSELKGFSRKSHSTTERKYAQEFLFNPPMSYEHDDRTKKVYSPDQKVFVDDLLDDLAYKPKKYERADWKKIDSDGSNDLYGGDWTKEMGINRKVLFVDPDKKSNFIDNKSKCQEQALLDEFDHVESVLSRTVSYKNTELCKKSSSKAGNFRNHAYISQTSSDFNNSDDGILPPPPPPPNISLNLEEVERQIEELDREFEKIIVNGSKSSVDLDLIEKKSDERRKLKNTLKQIKKQMKCGYQNVKWESVQPKYVFRSIKEKESMKPSFIIEGKFKDLEQAKEYFGRYGTLSKAEQVDSKVKLEYYEQAHALKALEAKHSKNLEFFIDPYPELASKNKKQIKGEESDDFTNKVIDSYFSQRSRHSPSDLRVNHFDDNINSCIQSQQVLDWPKKEERYPKIKKEFHKYSSADFKANKNNKFSITIANHRHLFNTEEKLYEYFVYFGDISSVVYTDGSEIEDKLDSRKEIRVDFEAGHSLLLALNFEHPDISVNISEDCKVKQEISHYKEKDCDPYSRKRKKSRDLSAYHGDVIGVGNGSPKHKKFDHFSDKENDKDYELGGENDKYSPHKRMTKSFDKKIAYVPHGHSKHAKWECQECGTINSPMDYFHCCNCSFGRPGNWLCGACGETNTPDKLYCFKRNCQEIRKGNWVCGDDNCRNVNWSRSLHCFQEGCLEVQPGAWHCKDCTNLNFKDNNNCFFCKNKSGMRARKRESFHDMKNFVKNAELEKQRQAFEKIHQDENRNFLEKPSFAPNDRLHPGKVTSELPRKEVPSETGRDWAKDFARMKQVKEKEIEEDRKKASVVQNKLLAIAGIGSKEPQAGPSGFGRGGKSSTFGYGRPMAMEEEIVDIADSDEELTVYTNANLEPVTPRRNYKEPTAYTNANLEPIIPRKNKMRNTQTKDTLNDDLMEKLKNGTSSEQAEILKTYNIIQIESHNPNVVEVDLASDSEDEAGRYSDGSSIHIEEHDMDVDQEVVTKSDFVGTVPRRQLNNSFGNLNHLKTSNTQQDRQLINQIVNKDLENINLNRNQIGEGGRALTFDINLGDDDDIVILSDEESVK
eukprot:GFUD01028048.1.p1 GENE.GFUD01028048.1~~GFUD01028048.1.p1  ORF type:complete len:1120 (+),score=253.78 GFUD01028048.1:169-3360(+)